MLVWTCFLLAPGIISMLLLLGFVCLVKRDFLKIIFQTLLYLFVNRKIDQWKIFFSQKKLTWFLKKCFFFWRKTLFRSYEKFRNIILFVDYNKFSPQTFDCYIFCFESFFLISPLRIWFNLIFILTLVLILWLSYLIIFNWNFLSIKFGPHSFDCYLFYLK